MEHSPPRPLTLFSEKGTIKSISYNKLLLESERAGSMPIYVPNNLPCAPNDHVEVTFELTQQGFIGRRIGTLPILPIDFLILTEYLRFAFISLVCFIGFLIAGIFLPVYFFSIILPVLLGFFTLFYLITAIVVGKNVPNYNRATISPFGSISPEQYSQFFLKGTSAPLIVIDGTLNITKGHPTTGLLLHEGLEFPLLSPIKTELKKFNNLEGIWIVSFRNGQIDILGKRERALPISWTLNSLLSLGLLFEVFGYVVFFLSIIPGFYIYGLGAPVPLPGDLLGALLITCMFVGCCLILVGNIANLKKRRIQNNVIVEYKNP